MKAISWPFIRNLLVLLWLLPNFELLPDDRAADALPFRMQIGEEFTYKVRWSFIRLGTVRLHLQDTINLNQQRMYRVKFYIDSNPYIFIVNMHSVFETYLNEFFQPIIYRATENDNDRRSQSEYRFDYQNHTIQWRKWHVDNKKNEQQKIFHLDEQIYDGLTLIYYARRHVHRAKTDTLIAFHEDQQGEITIHFTGRDEKITTEPFPQGLDCYLLHGTVYMKGIAGVTGPYKGWFSKDALRVPVKAELKVFIGNVTAELEKWKNWQPELTDD